MKYAAFSSNNEHFLFVSWKFVIQGIIKLLYCGREPKKQQMYAIDQSPKIIQAFIISDFYNS